MSNRRQNYTKARLTFSVAEMHHRAATSLLELPEDDKPSVLPSAYALYSLDTELYLKCLILENGENIPRSHDLLKLWKKLDDRAQKIIEDGYNAFCADNPQIKVLHERYPQLDWSIRGVISQAKDGFQAWRYFHEAVLEDRRKMISFNLHEATHSIRHWILYMYPNWEDVDNDEILGEREKH